MVSSVSTKQPSSKKNEWQYQKNAFIDTDLSTINKKLTFAIVTEVGIRWGRLLFFNY
jgi:hypothetical protein